ncbi:MAG: hypothetical protein BGN88_09580 [Clostridiales bacterium 43-6]|nr:MAG: hypothetical protein BGN88_09580 [Clostridiales bacterium 43-6]
MHKRPKRKLIIQISVILGVIILPLLYSYFYLGAFWDPYSTLNTLPVAVVNNDKGTVIHDTKRNLGEEMWNELNKDKTLKFIKTDETDATNGTKNNKYYAMIVVPSDFSANIASSSQQNKQTASILFSANEKRNFLASQILSKATLQIEEKLRGNVNKEITANLSDELRETPAKLTELHDGMAQLHDGSSKLEDGAEKVKTGSGKLSQGTADLLQGTNEFSSKFNTYKNGITDAKTGIGSLSTGADSLDNGIDTLLMGATALESSTKSLTELQAGAKTLSDNASFFNANMTTYTTGVSALIDNATQTQSFLTAYVAANPSLMEDPKFAGFITKMSDPALQNNIKALSEATETLKDASSKISGGLSQLSGSTQSLPQLQAAIGQIKQGLIQAKTGSSQLSDGAGKLNTGMTAISQATEQLSKGSQDIKNGAAAANNGATSLKNGTSDLAAGAKVLKDGFKDANDGVASSIITAKEKLKNLDGLDSYAGEPVAIKTESINPVPNYGTAFSPYFLSLSLWVGAIIIFVGIFLDSDNKFRVLSKNAENKVLRTFLYLLIGFVQAIVLAIVLKLCLGLRVNNPWLFLLSCCLVSAVFISIVQFFMVFLQDAGKFLSLLLLILQLTSCGGTFPMETVPKFFNVLYPFMPMTYSVNLFKEAISGSDSSAVLSNVLILSAILLVFTAITIVMAKLRSNKAGTVSLIAIPES